MNHGRAAMLVISCLAIGAWWWRDVHEPVEPRISSHGTKGNGKFAAPSAVSRTSPKRIETCNAVVQTIDGQALPTALLCSTSLAHPPDCHTTGHDGYVELPFCDAWITATGYRPTRGQLELGETAVFVLTRPMHGERSTGVVRDIDGGTVVGALVTIEDKFGVPVAFAQTDESGAFEFEAAVGTLVNVRVELGGYSTWNDETTAPTHLDILLSAEASVSGSVEAEDGSPVADARVSVEGIVSPSRGSGRTNADGHFQIKGLFPGEHEVHAVHADFVVTHQRVHLEPAASVELALKAYPGIGISGDVRKADVGCLDASVSVLSAPLATSVVSDGRYVTTALPSGSHEILAQCDGVSQKKRIMVSDKDLELNWDFSEGLRLSGTVHGLGESVRPMIVQAEAVDHSQVQRCQVKRDKFECTDLRPGAYDVFILQDEVPLSKPQRVDLLRDLDGIQLQTEPSGTLHVYVLDQNAHPVIITTSTARCEGGELRFGKVIKPGQLQFSSLPPGECFVLLDGMGESKPAVIEPYQETHMHLSTRQRTISGFVLDLHDNPIADALVYAIATSTPLEQALGTTVSDANGYFVLRNIVDGSATIEARSRDGIARVQAPDDDRKPLTLRLSSGSLEE